MGIFGKQAIKEVIVPAHMRGTKLIDSYEKKGKLKPRATRNRKRQ